MSEALTVPQPPRKKQRREIITKAQALKAAKECGLDVLRIGRLADEARIGAYIEQLGATKVGRGMVLAAAHTADDAIAKCDELIAQQDGDLPLVMDLQKLKLAYLDLKLRAAQAQMKAPKEAQSEISAGAPLIMAFPPGTEIAARVPETSKKTE